MRKQLLAFLFTISLLVPGAAFGQQAVKLTAAEKRAAQGITAAQLKDYLYFVASDAMGGRDTPSAGLDITAEFIKMNLQRWGFKPAGDNGTFFQKIDLARPKINTAKTTLSIGGKTLVLGTDYLAGTNAGSVRDARLVFAGDGWFMRSKGLDPYKNIDPKGKVVVLYGGLPRGVTFQTLRAEGKQGVDWIDPATYARQHGAAGIVTLASPQVTANWERSRRQLETGGGYYMEKMRVASPSIPSVILSQSASEALLSGEPADYAKISSTTGEPVAAFALGDAKTVVLDVATDGDKATTQNVVAIWEGSDPVLKNEMVAIGAHYDHVGTNPNTPGPDKIFNGADDDGSGTVGVLAIAEALAKSKKRPKRSVLFVWHCGEEKGLWGSEYFNKFPTVDIKQVIAQLNIDMIGRSKKADDVNPKNKDLTGENAIYVIGSEMMSSSLSSIVKGTNGAYLNLTYDLRYDDPKDTNRFFFRSDHFNYAVNGIPITFWFDGVHEDYHQPGDEPQKIDYNKMEKVARTIFLTMWELTDMKERPKVDKQLPAELTQR